MGIMQTARAAPMQLGNISRSIGVRPVINARGTFTIITGSTTLPEVKRAMDEASRTFVNMDELMDGVGKRNAGRPPSLSLRFDHSDRLHQ